MRLLHTRSLELEEFGGQAPPYAILSHTWGKEEVTLQGVETKNDVDLIGYKKVQKACSVAAADGFEYIWIDTCCIDKTSSAELSEALNSMYRWYHEAGQCYAYLADVPPKTVNRLTGATGPEFRRSKWFTRGWTLQELIAPSTVIFLDGEWQDFGTKSSLHQAISDITGIPSGFLLGDDLGHASVAQRMSWASERETKRVEDLAYCLMGLFGIYMPMLYGEGERAFIRLQEEIMRVSDDHSLFAWRSGEDHGGILATSPAAFATSGNIIPINPSYAISSPSTLNSRGIHLSLRHMNKDQTGRGLAILQCTETGKESMRFAIHLRDLILPKEEFAREQSSMLELVSLEDIDPSKYPLTSIYIRQWRPKSDRNLGESEKCAIKLEGVEGQEIALRTMNLDSNWELHDGLIVTTHETIPDGVIGRFLVVCHDGNFFQIFLKKYGRLISADISTSSNQDSGTHQSSAAPEGEHQDQDRVVKELGDGQFVYIAIKKRILLLHQKKYLTGVVEISYVSAFGRSWLEHAAVLDRNDDQKSLLFHAARRGLDTLAKSLLDRDRAERNSVDKYGRTPLSLAAEGGHRIVVELLLAAGSNNVDSKDHNGQTALLWAAQNGHESIVQLLLEKGAQLESRDKNHWTPLSLASSSGHEAVVRLLLEKGAQLESKDKDGETPLSYTSSSGHEAVVRLLLEKGAQLESKTKGGMTPLLWASYDGHEAVVRLLLEKGAELESEDYLGKTPLSLATKHGDTTVVKLLLEKGAKLESRHRSGRMAVPWGRKKKTRGDSTTP